jgi:hypothetical protein
MRSGRAGAPAFRSARLLGGAADGPLPRRRLGRTLSFSISLHLGAGVALAAMSLMTIDSVPPPPIVVTFLAPAPPPPNLAPLREKEIEPPPKPAPHPPEAVPRPVVPQPLILRPAEPRPRTPPPPLRVETPQETIRIAESVPEVRIRDGAPPEPRAPVIGRVDASGPPAGSGAEPEIAFLVPGESRRRGRGGDMAGRGDGLPPMRGAGDGGAIARHGGAGPDGGAGGIAAEGSFGGKGDASFLGRKYGVTMIEARRLGQRTSEGPRYALLLPMLSEACRGIGFTGRRRGAAGGAVESVQVEEREIAIRYRDGTLHVLVPTADGLVALYVSSGARAADDMSKVEEAERALGVLRRFMQPPKRS